MLMQDLTGGKVAGSGIIQCPTKIVGGVLISADTSNDVTVQIRKGGPTGALIFDLVTRVPVFMGAPFSADSQIYYSVSGANGYAQIFGWAE